MSLAEAHEFQGSAAWHARRRSQGNASEAAALMGCSPWFPRTPYELWLVKSGRAEVDCTPAMRRGLELEPLARAYVERAFDEIYEPQVVSRERLGASLDGISFDGRRLLEIKCPQQGRESQTWAYVASRRMPPDHYWWQVQQQLYCADARSARFVVCHAEAGAIVDHLAVEVYPDPNAHQALLEAWQEFFDCLDTDSPPALGEQDLQERTDVPWRDAVARWKEARRWLEEARRDEAEARQQLIELSGGQSSVGAGLRLTRYWKSGEIDWKRATAGLDVEPYRKQGGWQYRFSERD